MGSVLCVTACDYQVFVDYSFASSFHDASRDGSYLYFSQPSPSAVFCLDTAPCLTHAWDRVVLASDHQVHPLDEYFPMFALLPKNEQRAGKKKHVGRSCHDASHFIPTSSSTSEPWYWQLGPGIHGHFNYPTNKRPTEALSTNRHISNSHAGLFAFLNE